jgi:hypothetical protein
MKMREYRFVFFLLLVGSLALTNGINTGSAQILSLLSVTEHENGLDLSNGIIDPFWENVTYGQDVPELGSGGFVKFSNNGTHLYGLFAAPTNKIWISMQMSTNLAGTDTMAPGTFAWTFYINSEGVTRAEIQKFIGTDMPEVLGTLSFESVVDNGMVYIETTRAFDPSIEGDIEFFNGSTTYMIFASESQRYGHIIDEFTIFRLDVVVTLPGSDSEIEVPDIDERVVNWNVLKRNMLYVTLFGITLVLGLHVVFRLILNPLKKWDRIIDSETFDLKEK